MTAGETPSVCADPSPDRGAAATAHGVFRSVAGRYPDRTAAVYVGERVSYAELDAWSDAVAAALLERGVKSEEPVAIASPRSIAQVAGVLGVLKAGGAYVPLVANQPTARLATIAADAGCRLVVADDAFDASAFAGIKDRIDPAAFRHARPEELDRRESADDLAYIMYTSGSTGRPKGALIEHAGIVRLVCGQRYIPFGPDFHFLYAGPLSFDLSTIEIFTPLLHGAKLLISDEAVLSPATLRRYVREEDLRGVCVSFSLFRALFDADPGAFEGIPSIGVCGEPADPRVIRRAQERLPDAVFYNAYGPTECTALTTTHQIPRPAPLDPPVVPIGVPLEQMRVRIVDEQLVDVQEGEVGELLIGGVGLARGYLNDHELTATRFLRSGEDKSRWYRSGDRVRRLPDGAIAYLGRSDDQVKIRGQRIELGEVEAALAADPAVESAACVVVGDGENATVAACVVPVGDALRFDERTVLDRLAGRLTRAMLPSVLVPVDALPINRNGKVDRGRVAAIASGAAVDRAVPTEERTPSRGEANLLTLVTEVLGGRRPDPDRSFVESGGNSLQAMVLTMRARQRFGAAISVTDVLTAPSLRCFAESFVESASPPRPAEVHESTGPRPMTAAQLRLWTLQLLNPRSAAYNIAFRFRFSGPVDPEVLARAWQQLHERHPALRTKFSDPNDAAPHAEVVPRVDVKPLIVDSGAGDEQRAEAECVRPFDLAHPPLARLVVRPEPGGATGWLVMHHIISDAWSMEIMLRDLSALYHAIASRTDPALPPPVHGRPKASVGDDHEAIEDFATRCAEEFRGLPHTGLVDRLDGERPAWPRATATCATKAVPPSLRAMVEAAAARSGRSTHAVWLALYAAWVARLADQPDVAIGLAISTRDLTGSENEVGFFVETVPVRIDGAAGPMAAVIDAAGGVLREARNRRLVPFDMVVDLLADAPQVMRTPITEVFFNLIDRAPIYWPDPHAAVIRSDCIEVHNGLARFDLLATLYRDGADWSLSLAVRDGTGREPAEPMLRSLFAHAEGALQRVASDPAHPPSRTSVREAGAPTPGVASLKPGTPETHVLYTVLGVFREVLDEPSLAATDDFFRHGGNSLKAVRALSMLRDRLGIEVSTVIIFSEPTPERLSRALLGGSFHPASSPVYRMSPGPYHHALRLVPGIEGNLISFAPLVRRIGAERGCIGLEYPGLHAGSEPLPSISAISAYFRDLLGNDGPEGAAPPLVGYSFGGVVAFDMALAYQRQGLKPGPLVLIDSYLPERVEKKSRAERMRIYARAAIGLPTPDRLRFIRRRLRGFLHRRQQAREQVERRSGPLLEANLAALEAYRAADAYAGPVLIVRGRRPDWMRTQLDDGRNGWSATVTGPITIAEIAAEHSELLREQHADEVATHVAEWLRAFEQREA